MRDVLFQLLAYQRIISKLCLARDMDLPEKKNEVAEVQEKLLKNVEVNEERKMSSWRTA